MPYTRLRLLRNAGAAGASHAVLHAASAMRAALGALGMAAADVEALCMLLRGLLLLGEIPTALLGARGGEGGEDDGGGGEGGEGGGGGGKGGERGGGDGAQLLEACEGQLGVEGLAGLVAAIGESHPTAAAASRARDACVCLAYGRVVREVLYLL